MAQMLLFPDPRPLVERLGRDFFRQLPERPGVYLMRDAGDTVLYVGKAKNLRKRLGSYRVANPDRMARRHLRLLRAVVRIELEECADEAAALAREAELLRQLRPRFNRSGTWPGRPRFLAWRLAPEGLEVAVLPASEAGWTCCGPLGAGAFALRAALARLIWLALNPEGGLAQLPAGWFRGWHLAAATIPGQGLPAEALPAAAARLERLFAGQAEAFAAWVREATAHRAHPFEASVRDADLEAVVEFADRRRLALIPPPPGPGAAEAGGEPP